MKTPTIALLATLPLAFGTLSPAIANPGLSRLRVRTMYVREADGSSGTIPRLEIAAGYGYNINFMETGTTIKRIWLDNPNRFALDVDGMLCNPGQTDCEGAGASVIHLRLAADIDFPHLTESQSRSTLLTAIAEGPAQQRTLLQFELSPTRGIPEYVSLRLRQNPPPLSPAPRLARAGISLEGLAGDRPDAFARQIALGLSKAQQAGEVSQPEIQQVLVAIETLERGSALPEAAHEAGLTEARLLQLAHWANKPDPEPPPAPAEEAEKLEPRPVIAAAPAPLEEPEAATPSREDRFELLRRYRDGDLAAIAERSPRRFGLRLMWGMRQIPLDRNEKARVRQAIAGINAGKSVAEAAQAAGIEQARLLEIASQGEAVES